MNCSLQMHLSIESRLSTYFIIRWFVKIILIAMRLNGKRRWRKFHEHVCVQRPNEGTRRNKSIISFAIHPHEIYERHALKNSNNISAKLTEICYKSDWNANNNSTMKIYFSNRFKTFDFIHVGFLFRFVQLDLFWFSTIRCFLLAVFSYLYRNAHRYFIEIAWKISRVANILNIATWL